LARGHIVGLNHRNRLPVAGCFEPSLTGRAAALKGRSISDFVVNAAQDAAQRAIEDDAIIRLSAEDQARFAQALINPPAPNAALKRAMRRHVKNVDVR
jgi:uncharacterized protein (DUF1778 family)